MKKKTSSICPITYEPIAKGEKYSKKGLRLLSPQLKFLHDLPWSAEEQRIEARKRAHKISIQGVQPKLSARLSPTAGIFEITDIDGHFILKPSHELYPELPENEDLSMRLAKCIGIETPLHGLLYCKDGLKTYFIRRFDRIGRKEKLAVEDFAQLSGQTRETKYNFTMERIVPILEEYATFPLLEKREFFIRTIFNFLIGNEDMHLKNFSLITRDGKVEFAPAYDFLNSTLVLGGNTEELALPLRGKKKKLKRIDLIDYFGMERLSLKPQDIDSILDGFAKNQKAWEGLIGRSFLSEEMKEKYQKIVHARWSILGHS